MDDKFTIKDIIVFFISGVLLFLVFVISYPEFIFKQLDLHDKHVNAIGFIALPFFYILGHIVHAIDVTIFSRLGYSLNNLYEIKPNFVTRALSNLFNGHRIRGILKKYWKIDNEFIDTVDYCSDNIQYNEARYWSYLNDTFKCYTLIFFVFSISVLIRERITLGLIMLGLAILFRQQGRFFGIYYVEAISRIYHKKQNDQKEKSIN